MQLVCTCQCPSFIPVNSIFLLVLGGKQCHEDIMHLIREGSYIMGLLFGQIYLGKQLLHYPQILGLILCYDKMRRPFGECAIASCNCPCNFVFRYF